jgi:hypothetical protein
MWQDAIRHVIQQYQTVLELDDPTDSVVDTGYGETTYLTQA